MIQVKSVIIAKHIPTKRELKLFCKQMRLPFPKLIAKHIPTKRELKLHVEVAYDTDTRIAKHIPTKRELKPVESGGYASEEAIAKHIPTKRELKLSCIRPYKVLYFNIAKHIPTKRELKRLHPMVQARYA